MKRLKVCTVVGTRPQFVKAAAVTPVLREVAEEVLIHTGQHYDYEMSQVFFDQLHIPAPHYNLGVGSGSHGAQTGAMLVAVEKVLLEEKPDVVLVYGDTNSTLAGSLAAVKLHIPVVHVEAGLRACRLDIPEEVNRVLTDHASSLLCAPTETAMLNLEKEGLSQRSVLTGDVMVDVLESVRRRVEMRSDRLKKLGLQKGGYFLLTLHRPANVDEMTRLRSILNAISVLPKPILFPLHPRTRASIRRFGLEALVAQPPFVCVEPLGYTDMVVAESFAAAILTDSGGVQKEAYLLEVPCVTLRDETEWTETVEAGWNHLVGSDLGGIATLIERASKPSTHPPLFGDGHAGEKVVEALVGLARDLGLSPAVLSPGGRRL